VDPEKGALRLYSLGWGTGRISRGSGGKHLKKILEKKRKNQVSRIDRKVLGSHPMESLRMYPIKRVVQGQKGLYLGQRDSNSGAARRRNGGVTRVPRKKKKKGELHLLGPESVSTLGPSALAEKAEKKEKKRDRRVKRLG